MPAAPNDAPLTLEDFNFVTPEFAEDFDFGSCFTRMYPNQPINITDLAVALRYARGSYALAARLLARSRTSVVHATEKNEVLLAFRNEMVDGVLDHAEFHMFRRAEEGHEKSGRFILTTLGKDRGYTTRQENTGKDGTPIVGGINVVLVKPEDDVAS